MKVIIIGKNSFVATNLKTYLKKKKVFYKVLSFSDFLSKKNIFENFDYIINCSSNKNFVDKKYLFKNDHDTRIARAINKTGLKLIILSTRKVYKTKYNSKETDKILPKCNYSKNKSISEKKSYKKTETRRRRRRSKTDEPSQSQPVRFEEVEDGEGTKKVVEVRRRRRRRSRQPQKEIEKRQKLFKKTILIGVVGIFFIIISLYFFWSLWLVKDN